MSLLPDTHILIRALNEDPALHETARDMIFRETLNKCFPARKSRAQSALPMRFSAHPKRSVLRKR